MPKGTDVSLRAYLAQEVLRKGSFSDFVAEAVRWRLFDLSVTAARANNAGVPSEQIEDAIEEALAEVRAERFRNPV